jgi:hypothetical protein
MGTTAKGTFQVTGWDETTYDELGDGAKLTRATIGQAFTGDLEADVAWETLMGYRSDGTAVITGLARVTGTLGGRSGSFVCMTEGTYDGGEARSNWTIVEGSGTGGLDGLTGQGTASATSEPPGTYTLDYDL